jgi:ubiquinone/menaquinone biosynthesis C-methylase UbiE
MENLNTPEYWDSIYRKELFEGIERRSVHNYAVLDQYVGVCKTFLDVGSGTGSYIRYLVESMNISPENIRALDFSKTALNHLLTAFDGIKISYGDVRNLNFLITQPVCDCVTCFHTLEHIENIRDVLVFLYHLAKKYLLVILPIGYAWQEHLYVFDSAMVKKLFAEYEAKFYMSNLSGPNGNFSEMLVVIKK